MIEWVLVVYLVGMNEPLLAQPERVYPSQPLCRQQADIETVPGKTYAACKPRQSAR